MSSKRERPNSFAGLLSLGKPALPATEAPVVSSSEAERAIGVSTSVQPEVFTEVFPQSEHTTVPTAPQSAVLTEVHTAVLAPILRDRKKKERLLSWTVRLPETLKARLERASKKYEIDMTAIVVAGTRDYLDRYFPE